MGPQADLLCGNLQHYWRDRHSHLEWSTSQDRVRLQPDWPRLPRLRPFGQRPGGAEGTRYHRRRLSEGLRECKRQRGCVELRPKHHVLEATGTESLFSKIENPVLKKLEKLGDFSATNWLSFMMLSHLMRKKALKPDFDPLLLLVYQTWNIKENGYKLINYCWCLFNIFSYCISVKGTPR